MVYGTYNYSIHGVYKPTNITGGPHLVGMSLENLLFKTLGVLHGSLIDTQNEDFTCNDFGAGDVSWVYLPQIFHSNGDIVFLDIDMGYPLVMSK